MALEFAVGEFDYFKPQEIQTDIEKVILREYAPITAIQTGGLRGQLEFVVPRTPRHYLDLQRSFLYVKGKITKEAVADKWAANDPISVVNNPVHSVFKEVEVQLNDKIITDSNGLYPYRAYIETLFAITDEVKNTQMQAGLWYKDTGGSMDIATHDGLNEGFKSRMKFTDVGAEFELIGRPHADIFHQKLAIPDTVSMKLVYSPSLDDFVLIGAVAHAKSKFLITEAKFYVNTFVISADMALAHQTMLLKGVNMRFPLCHVKLKQITIPTGATAASHDNVYLNLIPNRLVIGLLDTTRVSGDLVSNPFNFEHQSLNHLSLYINGETIPSRPYTPDFGAAKHYLRSYLSLFQGTGTLFTDRSVDISRSDFAGGYALWVFDLSPGTAGLITSPDRTGVMRVEFRFSAGTANVLSVLYYAEFDKVLGIDHRGSIIGPN